MLPFPALPFPTLPWLEAPCALHPLAWGGTVAAVGVGAACYIAWGKLFSEKADEERDPAQDQKLSPGEIRNLKGAGIDPQWCIR